MKCNGAMGQSIIDGEKRGATVLIGQCNEVVIEGFTITNGVGDYWRNIYWRSGGGIQCLNSIVTIKDNIIKGNSAEWYGAAIDTLRSEAYVMGNEIYENKSAHIACNNGFYGGYTLFKDNHVYNNDVYRGGGVHQLTGKIDVVGNYIHHNIARDGAGVYIYDRSTANIIRNEICYNESTDNGGGGVMVWDRSKAICKNNLIHHNISENFGGGIGICLGDVEVHNCTIAYNRERNSHTLSEGGGGIAMAVGRLKVYNTIFWKNESDSKGSEIYVIDFGQPTNIHLEGCCIDWRPGWISLEDAPGAIFQMGHFIGGDPGFVGETNLHLKDESRCRDSGVKVSGTPVYDIDNDVRGGLLDIGADEIVIF